MLETWYNGKNARSARGGPAIIPHPHEFVNRQNAQKISSQNREEIFRQIAQSREVGQGSFCAKWRKLEKDLIFCDKSLL